jgi:hypothetical protein
MTTTCKNCKQQFKGKFCNQCGQSADTNDINFHFLWHDIQHGLLHFDKGIFYTIKQLFTRPGHSIKEFIEGQRVKHFKPISLVIVLAGIYGFLIHYFNISDFIEVKIDDTSSKVINVKKVISWISSHYAFTTLLLLPLTSLATYWSFKKEKYNYIQHFVINAFLSGLHIIIRLLFFPLIFLFDKGSGIRILTIPDIIGAGYTIWALYQFFDFLPVKKRLWKIILSYIYLGLMYILFVFIVGLIFGILLEKVKH